MFDFTKYDFSKESSFKDVLYKTMILVFEKSQQHSIELSDDELDLVAAAGGLIDQEQCPFTERRCEDCGNHISIEQVTSCRIGYLKK